MAAKEVRLGTAVREKMLCGVDILADAVRDHSRRSGRPSKSAPRQATQGGLSRSRSRGMRLS
jgi:hypothetical protein